MDKSIDWDNLGFEYRKANQMFVCRYKDGKWGEGEMSADDSLSIHVSATALHYGQTCFEGLKAYRTKDGEIVLFRPEENAKRMIKSCQRTLMQEFPVERFVQACKAVVKANAEFVPPYGSGATLYIRPFMFGDGANIGVKPAPEFVFCVFCMPVGAYFKGGLTPVNFDISDYDRAAPMGTGAVKVGGNYVASMLPHQKSAAAGFADCIYLDPATHTKIEEVGAANFFGITHDNKFVTPKSPSILPSITKNSLIYLAKNYLEMEVEERDVLIDNLGEFKEAGACGTAAVITPIAGISYKNKLHTFYSQEKVGPITTKLYNILTGIQFGQIAAPDGWIVKV